MTPAEHYTEAELHLKHASAAETGSYSEDVNLRLAAIHATLATVNPVVAAQADEA